MTRAHSSDNAVFTLTRCGILSAMAILLYYIEIPVIAFYKLDISTLPALLAGFSMGPLYGFAVVVIKNLIHMLGTSTACIGELADIIMSGSFVLAASIIYFKDKTRKNAILALIIGTITIIIAGVLVNYFILIPAYEALFHMDAAAIIGMVGLTAVDSLLKLVIFVTAPFNLLKGAVISLLTFLLYKQVSPFLHQKAAR